MSRPIADGLFTEGSDPRLLGARRISDGKIVFPAPTGKAFDGYESIELGTEGKIWSYTIQRFPPKPPYTGPGAEGSNKSEQFKPFAIGYVEIPGQVIVESYLKASDFSTLKVGLPVRLTTIPFREDADGETVLTYAFEVITSGL